MHVIIQNGCLWNRGSACNFCPSLIWILFLSKSFFYRVLNYSSVWSPLVKCQKIKARWWFYNLKIINFFHKRILPIDSHHFLRRSDCESSPKRMGRSLPMICHLTALRGSWLWVDLNRWNSQPSKNGQRGSTHTLSLATIWLVTDLLVCYLCVTQIHSKVTLKSVV